MYLKFNDDGITNLVYVKYKSFVEKYRGEATTLGSHHRGAETGTSGIIGTDDNSVNL